MNKFLVVCSLFIFLYQNSASQGIKREFINENIYKQYQSDKKQIDSLLMLFSLDVEIKEKKTDIFKSFDEIKFVYGKGWTLRFYLFSENNNAGILNIYRTDEDYKLPQTLIRRFMNNSNDSSVSIFDYKITSLEEWLYVKLLLKNNSTGKAFAAIAVYP